MHHNTAKPTINLTELAEVLAYVPDAVRQQMPYAALESRLWSRACEKPCLVEEVAAVLAYEARRRTVPAPMRAIRYAHA